MRNDSQTVVIRYVQVLVVTGENVFVVFAAYVGQIIGAVQFAAQIVREMICETELMHTSL